MHFHLYKRAHHGCKKQIGQVSIEEVRRGGGPFPLEISRRQEEDPFFGMTIGTLPSHSDSALPFRSERCDVTYRNLSRTRPAAPTGGFLSRSAPQQLGLERGILFSDGGQRSAEVNGSSTPKSGVLTEPLASSVPLPPAGIRAVMTRRLLSGSIIKRRRRGVVERGGGDRAENGGGGGDPVYGGTEVAEMGNKSEPVKGRTAGLPSDLRHGRKRIKPPSGTFLETDTAAVIDAPTHASTSVAPTPTQEGEKSVAVPEETLRQQQGVNANNPGSGSRSKGEHARPRGEQNTLPSSSSTGPRPLTTPDSVATTTAALNDQRSNSGGPLPRMPDGGEGERARGSGKRSVIPLATTGGRPPTAPGSAATTTTALKESGSGSGGPFPRIANDQRSTTTSVSRKTVTPPPGQRKRGDAAGTLGLGDVYGDDGVDREALSGKLSREGDEVVKTRINYADKTTADDIVSLRGRGVGGRVCVTSEVYFVIVFARSHYWAQNSCQPLHRRSSSTICD